MRISHNITALNTYRQYNTNSINTNKSMEKLSSGSRINRAADYSAPQSQDQFFSGLSYPLSPGVSRNDVS